MDKKEGVTVRSGRYEKQDFSSFACVSFALLLEVDVKHRVYVEIPVRKCSGITFAYHKFNLRTHW